MLWFLLGLVLGATIGLFVASLLWAARDPEHE